MTTNEIFQHFADNTTLHGAPRIIRSRSIYKRLFWLIVFVSATAMFSFQLAQLLHKYFSHEKRFNIEIRKDEALFPQVTVCNLRFFDLMTLRHLYGNVSFDGNRFKIDTGVNNRFITSLTNFLENVIISANGTTSADNFLDDIDLSPRMLINFNYSTLVAGSTHQDDFFLNSVGTDLNPIDYQMRLLFDTISQSQCFTYQSSMNETHMYSARNLPSWYATIMDGHGMLPTAKERQKALPFVDKLMGPSCEREGTEVYFSIPGSELRLLNPERFIFVPPGHVATFYVNMRSTERLGLPYGRCTDTYPFEPKPTGIYIQSTCYDACIQMKTIDSCACKSEELPYQGNSKQNHVPYCSSLADVTHSKQLSLAALKTAFNEVKRRKNCAVEVSTNRTVAKSCEFMCPLACVEFHYDIDMNMIQWPSRNGFVDQTAEAMMKQLMERNDTERFNLYRRYFNFEINDSQPEDLSQFDYKELTKELSFISVQLKNLDLTVTSEVPEYTVYQLLSDIGGQLGLWIGMSVITVAEMIELFVNLIQIFMSNCGNRPMQRHLSSV